MWVRILFFIGFRVARKIDQRRVVVALKPSSADYISIERMAITLMRRCAFIFLSDATKKEEVEHHETEPETGLS